MFIRFRFNLISDLFICRVLDWQSSRVAGKKKMGKLLFLDMGMINHITVLQIYFSSPVIDSHIFFCM